MSQNQVPQNQTFKTIIKLLVLAGDWPLLLAIRQGLAQVLPLIIVGSSALLLLNLPVRSYHLLMDKIFGENWQELCLLIQNGSFGIASLGVLIGISYTYTHQRLNFMDRVSGNPLTASIICLSAYFVLTLPLDGNIRSVFFSLSGGFPIALSVALTAPPLFLLLSKLNPFKRLLYAVSSDPEVNDALGSIPSGMVTILIFGVVRISLERIGIHDLYLLAQSFFGASFQEGSWNIITAIEYVGLSQFLWFFGVHGPNLLIAVEGSSLYPALQANITAAEMGLENLHIITKPFLDAFVHIGGSGSTLALILAILLKSKEKSSKQLALIAMIPALFNVNEVILFGLPLILNPVYFIPFLLAPLVQMGLAYAVTALGLVPIIANDIHWTSPILLGGYTATGSMAGALLQIACFLAGGLIYMPFVILANRVHASRIKRELAKLAAVAGSAATGPSGKKCVHLPGRTGQFARALSSDLARAVEKTDQIFLVYQPQIDIREPEITGAEALLRWRHPVYGLIPPHITVALAEDTGLINKLGMHVLYLACVCQASIANVNQKVPLMSVNFSAIQLEDRNLLQKVTAILKKAGLDPCMIKVEVTESLAISNDARTLTALGKLRKMGIRVAIDDFGMGHTSIRYLNEFPVDTVKIDRSLTLDSKDGINDHIVDSIVNLCEALNIQIVVEGVETPLQVDESNHDNPWTGIQDK